MLAPFSHYLQSNRAPSEDEACKIKALRVNPLQEISVIDVEIEQLEGILNSLKRKRAHIQKSIDDCSTILAPVRRLPVEILGVIFSYCLATHRNPIVSTTEAPILLTQICHDWRSIAFSIPQLWCRLYTPLFHSCLHFQPENQAFEWKHRMEAHSETVRRWLKLSATCPLSITIMPTGDISHSPILDVIMQSSQRWQQLELGYLYDSEILNRLLSLSADDLPMLREIRLHSLQNSMDDGSRIEDLWYQSGLFTAQGLRDIFIDDTGVYDTRAFRAYIPPNWKNLNRLFIHNPVALELVNRMLNCCCNLVACLLFIAYDTHSDVPITLPAFPLLTFLSLQGNVTSCSRLFSNIEAPSLRTLDYQGDFPDEDEEFGLLNFLQRINCLETLRVDEHALKYFGLIPSVTHLVLGNSKKLRQWIGYDPRPELASAIKTLCKIKRQNSPNSVPTVLFPSLEVFEAYDVSGVLTDTMVMEFIMGRIDATGLNTGVSKLRKVLVEFMRTRQTDIVPEVSEYAQAAGIELELDLVYRTGKESDESWSPSFGLSEDDVSWLHPLYDY